MADRATGGCAHHAMAAGDMAGHAAHSGTLQTTLGTGQAGSGRYGCSKGKCNEITVHDGSPVLVEMMPSGGNYRIDNEMPEKLLCGKSRYSDCGSLERRTERLRASMTARKAVASISARRRSDTILEVRL
jgi:hypothetical protein